MDRQLGKDHRQLSSPALSRLLDQFLEERLLLEAARSQQISVSEEEKKKYLNHLFPEGPAPDRGQIDDSALTERLLLDKYLQTIMSDIVVSEEEVSKYYELHKREFLLSERVKVSQILLDSEAKAVRLQDQLKNADEALFRRLARENSIGPEAKKGGELGVFSPGELPQEMEKVIFSLKEGELSPVVESPYGFHIFRLDKRLEPRLLTLEEAAPKIRAKLLEEKNQQHLARHLQSLKENIDWEFFPDRLSFRYEKDSP